MNRNNRSTAEETEAEFNEAEMQECIYTTT